MKTDVHVLNWNCYLDLHIIIIMAVVSNIKNILLRLELGDKGQLAKEDVIAVLRLGKCRLVKMQLQKKHTVTLHTEANLLELSPTLLHTQ